MQRPDSEPLDLSGLAKIDYSGFFLKTNPFPAIGIPAEVPTTTADRLEVIARFRDTLRQTLFENRSTITILTGEYGAGKSHLLKYFKYRVNTQLLTSSTKALAVYVKSVGRDFKDLYLYFIDDIGRDFLTSYALGFIRSFLREKLDDSSIRRYIYDQELLTRPDLTQDIEVFLKNSRFLDLFHAIRKSFQAIKNSDVIYAFLSLAHPDYSPIAWRWFLGERLSPDERQLISVDSNIDDAADAQAAFQAAISLLMQSGLSSTVLLIDEFEKLTLIPRTSRDRYMDELRHFIDDNSRGICMVIATTPAAYQRLSEIPSALTRRLSGSEFELRFFELQDIRELIARYLQIGRRQGASLDSAMAEHTNTSRELYPFTNEAVQLIYERSRGLVSSVVNLCRESIETGIQTTSPLIDAKLVKEIKL